MADMGRSQAGAGLSGVPPNQGTGRAYWRSLEHLADTPEFREFMHREFPAGASELLDSGDRRHFLKIMGASLAFAGLGLAGCRRWPEQHIAEYAHRPVGRDPGTPVQYATMMELAGVASGLLATSYDGRPIKIEGNPDHPTSRGAADAFAQASILDLYDPDRTRGVMQNGAPSTWEAFVAWAGAHFAGARTARGRGLAVLGPASGSPSLLDLRRRFETAFPEAKWFEYEPIASDQDVEGSRRAFGEPHRAVYDLEAARRIVCLDADLLGTHPAAVHHIRGFARGRLVESGGAPAMSRLYAFEPDHTLTGANADVRAAIAGADVAVAAAYLAARVLGGAAASRLGGAERALPDSVRAMLDAAAADLQAHRGASVVAAGWRQPAAVHVLAHHLNAALGNTGAKGPVRLLRQSGAIAHAASLAELARRIEAGEVETLVMLGGNPAYDAPGDLDFAAKLARVPNRVHLSDVLDETSSIAGTWHVNRAHSLETWGDGRAWDGTYTLGQPLIEPLFGGRSAIELLAVITGDAVTGGQEIVKRTFAEMRGGENAAEWRKALHDGHLAGSAGTPASVAPSAESLDAAMDEIAAGAGGGGDGWEVVFAPSPTIYDGRFANNGWLQEAPDPLTKLTWDNAVLLAPSAAAALGAATGDMVDVAANGRTVRAAVMVLPGIAPRSAILHLGFGRRFAGRVCAGAGFDFGPLRTVAAMGFARGASIAKAPGTYILATTQDHHTIDVDSVGGEGVQERLPTIFREAPLGEYREHEDFARHRGHVVHSLSLFEEMQYDGNYEWAMAIDLTKCVGCGACITACQAENNIPIVGKDQVARGREMHWLRVDRYFSFGKTAAGAWDPEAVTSVAMQPVMCMHCQNAPCETVCPVAATTHDSDGLNVMVYNRCIGTRYCSNNCPYKVRRFNYLDWHRADHRRERQLLEVGPDYFMKGQATPDALLPLQFNPDVTVRMRGVMEKCTYCVQRIARGRIDAKNAFARLSVEEKERRKDERIGVADGAVVPACAQTCPAEAIVFGDRRDGASRVARLQQTPRAYEMLEELNVDTRTRYLAKVRNPLTS
jgi:molybdopterin-containing oxidoreductase family iron-sulfur binding subunit